MFSFMGGRRRAASISHSSIREINSILINCRELLKNGVVRLVIFRILWLDHHSLNFGELRGGYWIQYVHKQKNYLDPLHSIIESYPSSMNGIVDFITD